MSEHVNTFTTDNYHCNYYEINGFNSKFYNIGNSYIKICHLNIRSLNLHKHELASYLHCLNCKFDIILLTECGNALKANVEEALHEYELYINPPCTSKGGAAILIRKNLFNNIELINYDKHLNCSCQTCKIESLWIKLHTHDKETFIIGCIYRHPNSKLAHFNDMYSKLVKDIPNCTTCIIGGDLNIDLLQYENNQIGENLNINLENNFIPCITLPTRITNNSATLIDHILVRLPKKKLQAKVNSSNLFCSISDHLMNFILLELKLNKSKDRPYVRLFTRNRINYFLQNHINGPPLLQTNSDGTLVNQDIQVAYPEFIKNYKTMLNKYFPLVKLSRKKFKDKPWITNGIKVSIKYRTRLFKKYIEKRTEANEQIWKKIQK